MSQISTKLMGGTEQEAHNQKLILENLARRKLEQSEYFVSRS